MTQTSTHYCTTHSTFNCRCCEDQIPGMSFDQFQSTRVRCNDLGKHFDDGMWGSDVTGYVYLNGTLWIQDGETGGGAPYYTMIERSEYESKDLATVERALYNYASNAGLIIEDEPVTIAVDPGCDEAIYIAIQHLIAEQDACGSKEAAKIAGAIRTLQAIRQQRGVIDVDGQPLLGASDDSLITLMNIAVFG